MKTDSHENIAEIQVIQGYIVNVYAPHMLFALNVLCSENIFLLSINTTSGVPGLIRVFKKDENDIYRFCSIITIGYNSNSIALASDSIDKIKLNGGKDQIINAFQAINGIEITLDIPF